MSWGYGKNRVFKCTVYGYVISDKRYRSRLNTIKYNLNSTGDDVVEATEATTDAEATEATEATTDAEATEATEATTVVEATEATPDVEATEATPDVEATEATTVVEATEATTDVVEAPNIEGIVNIMKDGIESKIRDALVEFKKSIIREIEEVKKDKKDAGYSKKYGRRNDSKKRSLYTRSRSRDVSRNNRRDSRRGSSRGRYGSSSLYSRSRRSRDYSRDRQRRRHRRSRSPDRYYSYGYRRSYY
jgi:hypothetical protein